MSLSRLISTGECKLDGLANEVQSQDHDICLGRRRVSLHRRYPLPSHLPSWPPARHSKAPSQSVNPNLQLANSEDSAKFHSFKLRTLRVIDRRARVSRPAWLAPRMPQGLDDRLRDSIQCLVLAPELQQIQDDHTTLVSTGCTKDFCQAGRALHTDEPRVGENRALSIVEQEAEHYLQNLHVEGFFDSEDAFQSRLEEVLGEIWDGAVEAVIREDNTRGMVGGNWTQMSGTRVWYSKGVEEREKVHPAIAQRQAEAL